MTDDALSRSSKKVLESGDWETKRLKCLQALCSIRGENTMETIQKTDAETIQEEVTQPEVSVEGGDALTVKAAGLQSALETVADGFSVGGFKCAKCGLAHMHSTNKHRASDSFDMSVDDTTDMEFNPNCHCGVQELGRHGSDFGIDERSAASTAGSAPIPDDAAREMNAAFGSL